GTTGVVSVLDRAFGFGLDLSGPHAVAVITSDRVFGDTTPFVATLARAIPAPDRAASTFVQEQISSVVGRQVGVRNWRVGLGRAAVGADGVAASYRPAPESLRLGERLNLDAKVVDARELLVYQVLLRDRPALVDLVESTLSGLLTARGGAQPMIDTLIAYYESGGNAARAAREL